RHRLRFLRSKVSPRRLMVGQVAVSLGVIILGLFSNFWVVFFLIPVAWIYPPISLALKAAKRTRAIEEQIETWLSALSNALKASSSLGEGIASTVPIIPNPISEEIDVLVKEYELGTPLDRALDNFAERIPSQTLGGAVLALKVARKSGGNL